MLQKGILLSFITVLLWSVFDIFARYAAVNWHVQPMLFVSFATLTGALTLLVIAGPGRLGIETMRKPQTWAYSAIEIIQTILTVLALALISATEVALLFRFTIVLSLIIAWFFFRRPFYGSDMLGALFVLAGCGLIVWHFPPEVKIPALVIMLLATLGRTLITVITEVHPTSNKAETLRDRCRCTGYVMAVSSLFFIALALLAAWFRASLPPEMLVEYPVIATFPLFSDFLDPVTLVAATALGVLNFSIATYYYFYATRIAKSEVFLMVAALNPVMTFFMEMGAGALGWFDTSRLGGVDVIACTLIVISAVFMVAMRVRRVVQTRLMAETNG